MEELPDLVQVVSENSKKDVDVLLVSFDLLTPRADRATVSKRVLDFIAERKWDLPAVVFEPVDLEALTGKFDIGGQIPVTLAFDKFGHLADREDGPAEKARFAALFDAAR